MTVKAYRIAQGMFRKTLAKPLSFIRDSRAVAAVEFAFIAPILLLLFIGTVEVSYLVAIDRKLSRTSSAIADLVTQEANPTPGQLGNFLGVTERIMYPYTDRIPCVVISTISLEREDTNGDGNIDDNDEVVARVENSIDNTSAPGNYARPSANQCNRDSNNLADDALARSARTPGSEMPVPDPIRTETTDRLVVAEVEYDHSPIVGFFNYRGATDIELDQGAITVGDRIYLRPRIR